MVPVPSDWFPYEKRKFGLRKRHQGLSHTDQRLCDDLGRDGHPHARERGLGGDQTCQHLELLASRTVSERINVCGLSVQFCDAFFFFCSFLFCIGILPLNNVVIVSGEQQRDSAVHIHLSRQSVFRLIFLNHLCLNSFLIRLDLNLLSCCLFSICLICSSSIFSFCHILH